MAQENDVGFIAMKPFAGGMLDRANLSIKYLLQFEGVVPDPGIETAAEIEEIIEIAEGLWEMTAQEQQEMAQIRAEVGTRFCRRCQYCMPCPEGVSITLLMNLGSFWKRFSPERIASDGFAQGVRTANNCVECGECEEKCPYHLPIREMLVENLAFYERVVG